MSRDSGLQILRKHVDAIVAHAYRDYPDEACGVIVGPAGLDQGVRLIEMENAAHSPTFYEFDSRDLLQLYRELDERDEEIVVVYHSHTESEAFPSRTDISYAGEPGAHYLLVSTRADQENNRESIAGGNEFRSFRIVDGIVTEEMISVLESF